jgi:7,8-dihydropterin-6-yl-methyl-4-(beta-D-ribofuranosyl)aminobenzene 5'-phosphate synthase
MKAAILSENRTNRPECLAEHGLSVYIETGDRKILFDLGASDIYIQNAKQMKIDLEQVDAVVISHGHYDHTGGAPSFCEINRKAKIYIHEKAFETAYGMENGKLDETPCSIRWTEAQRIGIQERLVLTTGVTWLTEDVAVSGTIPKPDGFLPTEPFYIKNSDGSMTVDPMDHEQFLAVRLRDGEGKSRGVFLFSGCSHNGVIPCLHYARALFPEERLLGLLAGMHLYQSSAATRREILTQIAAEKVDYILPVHCTGIQAICDLKLSMGEHCIPAGAGDQFDF